MNYFLVFPKIGGGDGGILIGEILAALLLMGHLARRQSLAVDAALLSMIALGFYYFLLSNIAAYLAEGVSITDLGYFCRFLMVLLLSTLVARMPSHHADYNRMLIYPAVLVALVSVALYVVFFLLDPPSISEILWSYRLGARLIPIFGVAIGPSITDIEPVGGGSGNLFGTLCTAALLVLNQQRRSKWAPMADRRYMLVAGLLLACAILTLSRAVFLTIALLLLIEFRKQLRPAAWIFFLSVIVVTLVYFADELAIFNRLADTFSEGGTDLSTSLRLENYRAAMAGWLQSPWTVIFGIGSNAEALTDQIGSPLVESFFLGLLCSTGVVGVTLFAVFVALIAKAALRSPPMALLLKFYVYESVFLWSVGGGDFWGPVALYVTAVLFGLHYRQYLEPAQSARRLEGPPTSTTRLAAA